MLSRNPTLNPPCTPAKIASALSLQSSVDAHELKEAMASLAFPIAVVTAQDFREQLGRTVTSFMTLSVEPARVMISIDMRSRLVDLIARGRTFSVSFLSAGQQAVADAFAGKLKIEDRFSVADWDQWPSANPKLSLAVVAMDCEVQGSLDTSDHVVFLGAVVGIESDSSRSPLMWSEGTTSFSDSEVCRNSKLQLQEVL